MVALSSDIYFPGTYIPRVSYTQIGADSEGNPVYANIVDGSQLIFYPDGTFANVPGNAGAGGLGPWHFTVSGPSGPVAGATVDLIYFGVDPNIPGIIPAGVTDAAGKLRSTVALSLLGISAHGTPYWRITAPGYQEAQVAFGGYYITANLVPVATAVTTMAEATGPPPTYTAPTSPPPLAPSTPLAAAGVTTRLASDLTPPGGSSGVSASASGGTLVLIAVGLGALFLLARKG